MFYLEICKTIDHKNNWFGRNDILREETHTLYDCKQYCYQNMKSRFYNDWTFNPDYRHCRCEVKDSYYLNGDYSATCCTAFASNIMSYNLINICEFLLVTNVFIKKILKNCNGVPE